jgi:SET domain-containing protein
MKAVAVAERLVAKRSHVHGWGLFVLGALAANDMIVEYTGETVRGPVADLRERLYELQQVCSRGGPVAGAGAGPVVNAVEVGRGRRRGFPEAQLRVRGVGSFFVFCWPHAPLMCVCVFRPARSHRSVQVGSCYLFRLDRQEIVDATRRGGPARFINHSCEPNAYARVVHLEGGAKKIVFFALRALAPGDEVFYDYKFPIEDDKIPCTCGSPACRLFLN